MQKKENYFNFFIVVTFAILVALITWFIILPFIFNSGSSLIKDIFSKKEEIKIETFSAEAFAYDLGDSWEVNATTRVKGFNQKEEGNNYSATIAYDVDLVTPAGDTIKALVSRVEDKTDSERIMDIPLEAQFELDSTYAIGEYTIIFNVKDALSGNLAVAPTTFKIENE